VRRNICVYLSSLPRSEKQHLFRISPCIIISCRGLARATLHTNQCSRKRVQQLKKRKKSCFLKFEKNVKNVKKRRPIAYVQFHRPLNQTITQPLILNYRNQNSVPVPVSHQHHTPCSEMLTQETNMQLTCRSVIVKRL